ncbi:MAG: histidine ammonia-lyase [Clostridiaceae bacterium]
MENIIILDGNSLSLEDLVNVSRRGYKVALSEKAVARVEKSRKIVEEIVENNRVVYGVTTGFGKFADVSISKDQCKELQTNIILSHSCGAGALFPKDAVRAIILLRANALAKGYSGVRMETLNTLIEMLNKGLHPQIPEKGSLGSSGDLAPLSHMVLPMLGEGEAEFAGEIMPGAEAMKKAGIPVIELGAKEGLALINGTCVMTAVGALALHDGLNLVKIGDIAISLTMEALRGITNAYSHKIQEIRPHKGQMTTSKNVLSMVEGSTYVTEQGKLRVQDAYSLRCVPQVHGAIKDAVNYIKEKVLIEMNSATDNPIITEDGEVLSGGNFHGEPMALSFDFLGIAISELANISERRLERLINFQLNDLPPFLVKHGGLNSGFMITQYAAAALVSENKVLAHPASVDSIPSSANQEDHVSMGTIAARKSMEIVKNARRVLTTEIMAACQAIDFRSKDGLKLGTGTTEAYNAVREVVSFLEKDTIMYTELNKIEELLISEKLLERVEKKVKLKE